MNCVGSVLMSKTKTTANKIIALAYFHRYGWVVPMIVCVAIWPEKLMHIFSISCIIYSIWSFMGYKLKWKHIYCSFQSTHRERMTPHHISWCKIKKSEAYVTPLLFFAIGMILLIFIMLY